MDINSFLPAYPSVEERKDDLVNLFPEGFYQGIHNKKEFNQASRLIPQEPRGAFIPQGQQVFAPRYISSKTPYESVLIVHSVGLGKTALSAFVGEDNIGKNGLNRVLFLVPNKNNISNVVNEIDRISGGKYQPEDPDKFNDVELARRVRAKIRAFYKFETFGSFANSFTNKLKNSSEQVVLNMYRKDLSNRIIIIDEVHNLRVSSDGKSEDGKVYSIIHKILHAVENCKIVLMTATPMNDQWVELADIANLLLPKDDQLPRGKAFQDQYTNDGSKIKNVEVLKKALKGKVSTLFVSSSDVKKEIVGSLVGGMKVFKVDAHQMSDFQAAAYKKAFQKDGGKKDAIDEDELEEEIKGEKIEEKKASIYSNSRQAVNFVFPDGSWGEAGYSKYMNSKTSTDKNYPKMSQELKAALTGRSHEEMLGNLEKYSKKYADTIRIILKGGKAFVFNKNVVGSGAILFARILELYGYTKFESKKKVDPKKKYFALITSRTANLPTYLKEVQEVFNRPDNAEGQFIQVLVGSQTSGESLSFFNIEHVYIHTPHWNYSMLDQVIGRSIRYRAHEEIQKIFRSKGKEFTVKIHHCASVGKVPEESIDILMYKTAEDKDRKIKLAERLLKEISYDCAVNRKVNMKGEDFSRECEFLPCEYKCEGISEVEPKKLDESTFNLFYSDGEARRVINLMKEHFRTHFSLSLDQAYLLAKDFHPFVVVKALKILIDSSEAIYNRFGFRNFLREENDVYFLIDSIDRPPEAFAAYYTMNPAIKLQNPISKFIRSFESSEVTVVLDRIYELASERKFGVQMFSMLDKLSLELKQQLVEAAIDAEYEEANEMFHFREWLLTTYSGNIQYLKDGEISVVNIQGQYRCRYPNGKWKNCTHDSEIRELLKAEQSKKEDIEKREDVKYQGIINYSLWGPFMSGVKGAKMGFWLRGLENFRKKKIETDDKRKHEKGTTCGTGAMPVKRLAWIAYELNAELKEIEMKVPIKTILTELKGTGVHGDWEKLPEIEQRKLYSYLLLGAKNKNGQKGLCQVIKEALEKRGWLVETTKTTLK
jgi:superfamily II DNA or RNA helicase